MTTTDKNNIYTALINLLTSYCDVCIDKHQMEKILLSAFKLDLIEYAGSNDADNVEDLWISLAKTLGIKLNDSIQVNLTNKCDCVNGICSLC